MLIKSIFFSLIMIVVFGIDAFAAPTVRKFGNVAPVTTTNNRTATVPIKTSAVLTNSATSSASSSGRYSANRMAVTSLKPFKNFKSKNTLTNTNTSDSNTTSNPNTSDTGNAITEVVSGSGNYVTDIAVSGNKLNVSKTNSIYIPVKSTAGATMSGDAEIWVVK